MAIHGNSSASEYHPIIKLESNYIVILQSFNAEIQRQTVPALQFCGGPGGQGK